ncbi:MAG: disulfide bond formation protein B [Methylococcaceae bacterium]|nr:disulfide bond formation protein B [Methylococcaceae bacterium]
MLKLSAKHCFLLGFIFCVGLILSAFYFQFIGHLDPCPLCISQRLMVVAVGLVLLVAYLHAPGPRGIRNYAIVGGLVALVGASVSARHVWIQHLPADEVPACGPGLSYMFQYFPLSDTLKAMVTGTGDCAKADWSLLGLSMPAWVLLCFLGLSAFSFAQVWNTTTRDISR